MKTFFVPIALFVVVVVNLSHAQGIKLPKNIEQVSGITDWPGHDTVAAFYRHIIDGYADKVSLNPGDTLGIYVSINKSDSSLLSGVTDTIRVFRYGLTGWVPKGGLYTHSLVYRPFSHDSSDYKYGARWTKTLSVRIDPSWPSGIYSAQMTAVKNNVTYHGALPFVVKPSNPGSTASILWVVPTNTYQAYNAWGGSSLYWTSLPNSIYVTDTVSFDRPWGESWTSPGFKGIPPNLCTGNSYHLNDSLGQFLEREWAWVKWMELQNYAVEYCADYDVDQNLNNFMSNYKSIVIPGHSEYWSQSMRTNIENYIQANNQSSYGGGNVAFFAANNCYWFVTYYSNGRQMQVVKRPDQDLWRASAHHNPEAKFIGEQFVLDSVNNVNRPQFALKPNHWMFESSGILAVGDSFGLGSVACDSVNRFANLDYIASGESDDTVNGLSPSNTQVLARVRTVYGNVSRYSSMTYYMNHGSNGRIFSGGGHGWYGGLFGIDSQKVGPIVRNIINHFSWRTYVDTIFSNITWDKNLDVVGNTFLQSGQILNLSGNATVTICASDTLFVNGTLQISSNITIAGSGVVRINPSGVLNTNASTTLTIANGVTLLAQPGSTLKFGSNSGLSINGKLIAKGTSGSFVSFTSSSSTPAAGDWYGISLLNGPDTLQYCKIKYAQYGLTVNHNAGTWVLNDTVSYCSLSGIYDLNAIGYGSLWVQNSVLRNNSQRGILMDNGWASISSTLIRKNGYDGIILADGAYLYIDHSTIDSNAYVGIRANSLGSSAYLALGGTGQGWNTVTNNSLGQIWVNLEGTIFIGDRWQSCDCGGAASPVAPPEISSGGAVNRPAF